MDARDILAILFGLVTLIGVIGGLANRFMLGKAIGTQFIRYMVVVIALPLAASLAFLGMLTEAVVSIVLGALGYVFAGAAEKNKKAK